MKTYSDWQISMHASGEAHPTSFLKSMRDAIPGKTMSHNGNSFKYPASIQPPFAWVMFLDASVLWTMTWIGNQKEDHILSYKYRIQWFHSITLLPIILENAIEIITQSLTRDDTDTHDHLQQYRWKLNYHDRSSLNAISFNMVNINIYIFHDCDLIRK